MGKVDDTTHDSWTFTCQDCGEKVEIEDPFAYDTGFGPEKCEACGGKNLVADGEDD